MNDRKLSFYDFLRRYGAISLNCTKKNTLFKLIAKNDIDSQKKTESV
jgi:hypothetical protein